MSKQVKMSGTKPNISTKSINGTQSPSDMTSILDIPAECQQELDAAGLEGRWIDVVGLKKNHGWHKRSWSPYKFKCLTGTNASNPFGAAPGEFDGYLLRQQLVLAALSKDKAQERRDYIKRKTMAQSDPAGLKKAEFKEYMERGIKGAKVHGFDDSDDE